MKPLRRLSVVEQIAGHLRDELGCGRWSGKMPGAIQLAAELAASSKTTEAALRLLEAEGLLSGQGPGRSRVIVGTAAPRRALRIGILLHDELARENALSLQIYFEMRQSLENAGFDPFFSTKSQVGLGFDLGRIRRYVERTPANLWVVGAGTREVLELFANQTVPSIALFGRLRGLPIAGVGPDKVAAYAEVTRELLRLGHRHIVMLCRKLRRLPEPGAIERAYLAELAAHGIETSAYNLPDWEESVAGFHARLAELFKISPPTAIIVDEPSLFAAAQQFLASQRLCVPEHVSLVCTDYDASFDWLQPAVSHIRWHIKPVVRRILRWADAVSKGRRDLKQTLIPAEFVRGGTIGPVSCQTEDHTKEDRRPQNG